MRVVGLWAVLAALLAALTGPADVPGGPAASPGQVMDPGGPGRMTGPQDPAADRRRADAVIREHPEIWTGAEVVGSGRALVVALPGGADPADLARRADRASAVVARLAGPVRPLVLAPATTAQAAVLAAPADLTGLAAVAGAGRVIVEPVSFARLSPVGRDVVLAHELTHVATGASADGRTPTWLVEGFADYAGYLGAGVPVPAAAAELAAEVRAGRVPAALPGREDFAAGAPRAAQAYEEAWLACRYVAGRFGERALVTLYRESMRGDAGAALTRATGMGTAQFTAAWRAYVRTELS
ncbi:hypothetical protein [Sphaerisporangium corydalis]|uniref:hypothetical protein n=1 Tax=Sphaerisporangium corydalis TaxID=1441875 RepID=UPI0021D0B920|nr:hypothetical protein [Sphaerisporangium corydalis]